MRLAHGRVIFLTAVAWLCGLLSLSAVAVRTNTATVGQVFYNFLMPSSDGCAYGGHDDYATLTAGGSAPVMWGVFCGLTMLFMRFLRSRPGLDPNLRLTFVAAAVPIIMWAACVQTTEGVFSGFGPVAGVALGMGSTAVVAFSALLSVLHVPFKHALFARGRGWWRMWLAHRASMITHALMLAALLVFFCTPWGALSSQDSLGPLLIIGACMLGMLTTVEMRSSLVGAMDAWERIWELEGERDAEGTSNTSASARPASASAQESGVLASQRSSTTAGPRSARLSRALLQQVAQSPGAIMRIHALASVLPVMLMSHVAAFAVLILVGLPGARVAEYGGGLSGSFDVPPEAWSYRAEYAILFSVMGLTMLRYMLAQWALKGSGENVLLAGTDRAHSGGERSRSTKLRGLDGPLLPPLGPSRSKGLAASRRGDDAGAVGSRPRSRRSRAGGQPQSDPMSHPLLAAAHDAADGLVPDPSHAGGSTAAIGLSLAGSSASAVGVRASPSPDGVATRPGGGADGYGTSSRPSSRAGAITVASDKSAAAQQQADAVSQWATSWTGQQVIAFTSHVVSLFSLGLRLAVGDVEGPRGKACEQVFGASATTIGLIAIAASTLGLLINLHTIATRRGCPGCARVLPVDDSFRLTVTVKSLAVVLKATLLRLTNEDRSFSFWLVTFAAFLSVCVLLMLMYVRMERLLRGAKASRRAGSLYRVDPVLEGVAVAADPEADLFQGVRHPRLLVWCYLVGYASSVLVAFITVLSGALSSLGVSWFAMLFAVMLPTKWVNNELALFLRGRLAQLNRLERATALAPAHAHAAVATATTGAHKPDGDAVAAVAMPSDSAGVMFPDAPSDDEVGSGRPDESTLALALRPRPATDDSVVSRAAALGPRSSSINSGVGGSPVKASVYSTDGHGASDDDAVAARLADDQTTAPQAVDLGASMSSEGVRSLLSLASGGCIVLGVLLGVVGDDYQCGPVGFGTTSSADQRTSFDTIVQVFQALAAGVLFIRNVLLVFALDGFPSSFYTCGKAMCARRG